MLGEIEVLKQIQIQPGSVFKMEFYPKDKVTPKGDHAVSRLKFFVVLGVNFYGDYVGVTLINTNVNVNFASIIAPYQHCIYPEKYDFLNGQYRYVDCYSLREIEKARIINNAKYVGYLNPEDLLKIKTLLRQSPVIGKSIIKEYGLE